VLLGLSNVKRMDLLAHPGEVQLTHLADASALNIYTLLCTVDVFFF
jgi:hypothetical protein